MKKTTMKMIAAVLGVLLGACSLGMAQATEEKKTLSQALNGGTRVVEGELVPAAEAMPENKYDFAPTNGEFKGVRSFAEQVKHVAATNYLVGAAILGEKPPVDTNGEKGPDSVKSKTDIVKFLKDSFAYAHKATASITDANALEPIDNPFAKAKTTRAGLATVFAWHSFDHYGQIVEYLRMNGIVPPASRN
jgi:uncharacterized damage-inducible protein DinB